MDYYLIMLLGFVLSLALVLIFMPLYIKLLKSRHYEQQVSEYALEEYKQKSITPTMGGVLFVVAPIITTLIICPGILKDRFVVFTMLAYFLFFLVGFIDDLLIIIRKNNDGLSPKAKMILQLIFGFVLILLFKDVTKDYLMIHMLDFKFTMPFLVFALFGTFLFSAETNAVNFTDGMDGLCAGVSFICLIPFIILCLIAHQYNLAIFIACVEGALIGYLKFNFFPAKIFMGDSGSLALGALFVAIAMCLKRELLLIVLGGVFLYEMVCVVAQQIAVRVFHRRIFKYTPIHYAFVIRGLKEKKVVILFYILAIICSVAGLILGLL